MQLVAPHRGWVFAEAASARSVLWPIRAGTWAHEAAHVWQPPGAKLAGEKAESPRAWGRTGENTLPDARIRPYGLVYRSKHQAGPFPRSVSCTCLPSALLTNSTESIAAPSWMRNSSIASFIGGGRSPHQSIA